MQSFCVARKRKQKLWPIFMDRVQLSQGSRVDYDETIYFLPLSSLEWKAEKDETLSQP